MVRFTILEPACQCQLVTSLRSPASTVFGEAFGSRCVGAILTVVTEAVASTRWRPSDGNLSDFARGGWSFIAEGGAASVPPVIVRAPVVVLSANSALKTSRQIKASQMVRGIAISLAVPGPPKEEPGFRHKKGFRRFHSAARVG
jgi:hypothetical protein